jgi:glycopeptide antibiotics resistance protein
VSTDAPDHAVVFPPPPLVYLGGLLIGLLVDFKTDLPSLGLSLMLRTIVAVAMCGAGALLLLMAAGLFRRTGTDVKPWKPTTARPFPFLMES